MKTRGFLLAMRLSSLGWYVAVSVIGGTMGGIWLDRWLGTLPLFTLGGVALGTVVAFYGVYKMVAPLMGGDDDMNEPDEELRH